MVDTETAKVLATSSLDWEPSTVFSTLTLRSFEHGFIPEVDIRINFYACRCHVESACCVLTQAVTARGKS